MWLAETAVDTASLEVLAEAGVKFTILSPYQAQPLAGDWRERGLANSRRRRSVTGLHRRASSGRSIALFFYDGSLRQAFERLLDDGERFVDRLLKVSATTATIPRFISPPMASRTATTTPTAIWPPTCSGGFPSRPT